MRNQGNKILEMSSQISKIMFWIQNGCSSCCFIMLSFPETIIIFTIIIIYAILHCDDIFKMKIKNIWKTNYSGFLVYELLRHIKEQNDIQNIVDNGFCGNCKRRCNLLNTINYSLSYVILWYSFYHSNCVIRRLDISICNKK